VSGLYPLYARSLEAFGAGKAFLCPGYKEHDYKFQCDLDPDSMANAIIKVWENYDQINFRSWAEKYHDVRNTVKQSIDVYNKFL
jgi:glycosyltransferase involved in cell wall biosynthesis